MNSGAHAVVAIAVPCAGCRSLLPAGAVFCVECGLSMLDVTRGGTVITQRPLVTTVGEIAVPSLDELRHELREVAPRFDVTIELDLGDLELVDEEDLELELLDVEDFEWVEQTAVTRGPVPPAPFWDAPARGETVIGRPPRRRTASYESCA